MSPWLHQIDPVLLNIGPVAIHWYGLMYLLAFASFWFLARLRLRGRADFLDDQQLSDLLFYGALGVILGGRFGYVLFYGWEQLLRDPLSLLRIWEGGMSFHGGLLGVIVAILVYARRQRRSALQLMDFVAPLVPPGLFFGRIGNFIGGELWGKPTDSGWGVVFPQALPDALRNADLEMALRLGLLDEHARHPSQLYQALGEGLLLFVLLWWISSRPRPAGMVAGWFAIGYALCRFAVEFVREPDLHIGYLAFGWLTQGQLLCLPLLVVGIVLVVRAKRGSAS